MLTTSASLITIPFWAYDPGAAQAFAQLLFLIELNNLPSLETPLTDDIERILTAAKLKWTDRFWLTVISSAAAIILGFFVREVFKKALWRPLMDRGARKRAKAFKSAVRVRRAANRIDRDGNRIGN